MTYHAFYSAKQAAYAKTNYYRKSDGSEVEVTEVFQEYPSSPSFPDAHYLGEVIEWVRHGKHPPNMTKTWEAPFDMTKYKTFK